MLTSIVKNFVRGASTAAASATSVLPVITSRKIDFPPINGRKRAAWVENFDSLKEERVGLIDLHPDIFAEHPRIDLLHANFHWQRMYKFVSYAHVRNRAELRGGGRKPWPQKGGGRARHGSLTSPLFKHGGISHGPRAFTTHFYMLPFMQRVHGLIQGLSIKLAQDDLYIIDKLDIPTSSPSFLLDLFEERNWGPSVLIVDESDIIPKNLALATKQIAHVNVMPVYGLNVHSMLKHDTLVLTLSAVNRLEERLLFHLHRADRAVACHRFKTDQI